jgi:hypothetical protein
MAYLLNALSVQPGSHLAAVGSCQDAAAGDAVLAQLIGLGEGQDASVEADFMAAHLPFYHCCLQGSDSHGVPWILLVQVAPAAAAALLGTNNVYWPMAESVDRVLIYNAEASVLQQRGWQRPALVELYGRAGVEAGMVADWTAADLVLGLIAECCHVSLPQVVAGWADGCAFPNLDHDCAHDVFADVFAQWTQAHSGPDDIALVDADDYLLGWAGPEPAYAARPTDDEVLYYWPEHDLKKMSAKDLRKLAARCKWGKRKTSSMKRKALVKMLATPHARNKGKGAQVASVVPEDQ